jgi:hypothetical protein
LSLILQMDAVRIVTMILMNKKRFSYQTVIDIALFI